MIYRTSKIKPLFVVPLFLIALPLSTSLAAVPVYAEIGYLGTTFKQTALRANVGLIRTSIGYQLNDYFSIEGYYGTKSKSKTVYAGRTRFKVSAQNFFGGYLKAQMDVDTNLKVYAKVGASSVEVRFESDAGNQKAREGSFSYALGAQYAITNNFYLMAGYEDFYHRPQSSISGWSLSIGYRF